MNKNDPEILVSFADLWQICKDAKRKILFGAITFACLAGLYSLTQSIEYEAQATFREKARSQSGTNSNSLTSLLFYTNNGSSSEAITMLKSRKILERVVKQTGLQASITKNEIHFNTLANIRDNIIAEYAFLRGKSGPILSDLPTDITAQEVTYHEDLPLTLKLEFTSEKTFHFSCPRNIAGTGEIGIPVAINDTAFTIVRSNNHPITSEEYILTIQPLRSEVLSLLNKIKIETDRDDKSLLKLKYAHSNRYVAPKVLNTLMQEYQNYLGEEQQHILREQVGYLQVRHDRMQQHLQRMMEEYAAVLTSDVTSIGFPDSNKAMDFLAMRQTEYSKEILSLDLELKRLQKTQTDSSDEIVAISDEQLPIVNPQISENDAVKHSDAKNSVDAGVGEINRPEENQFQGLNLETAKELYIDYNKQLNLLEGDILQQRFILDQIKDPEFEISSLSTVLHDSVSNEMISKASSLLLSLRDQRNRSAKDQERLKNELDIKKGFLAVHLKQTLQLLELRQKLLQEKIQALLNITLGLIKQERTVIEQHQVGLQQEMAKLPKKWVSEKLIDQQMEMNKRMVEEITKLVETKNITSNLELIQSAPIDKALAPLKPRSPYVLLLTVLGAFIGAVISLCFSMVHSIRRGVAVTEDNLRIAGQTVLGTLSKQYQTGMNHPCTDGDLALFRRITLFLDGDSSKYGFSYPERDALLVIGRAPDYSHDIAALLAKKGLRVLLLPLSFDSVSSSQEQEGLLPYLEGRAPSPKIEKMNDYDIMPSAGISRYANEYIGSRRFADLLFELRQKYDWVIATTNAEPNSAEAEHLIHLFSCSVITITDQKWHQLESCLTTEKRRSAFVLKDLK